MNPLKIYYISLIVILLGFLSATQIIETEMYKQLLDHPEFKPCSPIGCGIQNQGDNSPVCGHDGNCRPCMRDGQCVMAYRIYLNEFQPKARCNRAFGSCSKQ